MIAAPAGIVRGQKGDIMTTASSQKKNLKITDFERDFIRNQYVQVWGKDSKMVNYCVNKTAQLAILPDGGIVTVDKEKIDTHFCFGEHGYDYNDALAAAQHARTSAEYFKRKNMESFERWINDIKESMNGGNYRLMIGTSGCYIAQPESCRLRGAWFASTVDIVDACGGSCYLDDLQGKELFVHGRYCRMATEEEHRIILEAYQKAAKTHEKKVDAYLKRYGLSKVHAWTYWADA